MANVASRRRNSKNAPQATRRARWARLFPRSLPFAGWRKSSAVERIVSWFKSPSLGGRSYAMATPLGRVVKLGGMEGLETRVMLAANVEIGQIIGAPFVNMDVTFEDAGATVRYSPNNTAGNHRIDVDNIINNLNNGLNVVIDVVSTLNESGDITLLSGTDILKTAGGDVFLKFDATSGDDVIIEADADIISTSGKIDLLLQGNPDSGVIGSSGDVDINNSIIDSNGGSVTLRADDDISLRNATSILTRGGDFEADADACDGGSGEFIVGVSASINTTGSDGNVLIHAEDVDLDGVITAGAGDITFINSMFNDSIGIGSNLVGGPDFHLDEGELQRLSSTGTVSIGRQGNDNSVEVGDADLSAETYNLRIFGDNDGGGNDFDFTGIFTTGENVRVEIHHTDGDVQDESEVPDASTPNLVIPGTSGELLIRAINVGTTGGEFVLDISVARLDVDATGDVNIDNTGALELVDLDPIGGAGDGMLSAVGFFNVAAESPLTVTSPIVALGTVTLTAVDDTVGADDDLIINASITSTTGDIDLNAGEDIRAVGVTLSAVAGQITFEGDTGGTGVADGGNAADIFINNVTFETNVPILISGNDQDDTFTIRNVTLGDVAANLGSSIVIDGDRADIGTGSDSADLDNVHISNAAAGAGNPDGDGLLIEDVTDFVTIDDSSFNDNVATESSDGIQMTNVGDVTFTNVEASRNDPGVTINTAASFSDTDGIYRGNEDGGIVLVDIAGNVTLTRTILEDNDSNSGGEGDGLNATDGGDLDGLAIGGNLTISGALIRDTSNVDGLLQQRGVYVPDGIGGDLTIERVTSPANMRTQVLRHVSWGVYVDGGVNANVDRSDFNRNGDDGIHLRNFTGNVGISNVNANNNADDGIKLNTTGGNVTMTNVTANDNGSEGLRVSTITTGNFSDTGGNYNRNGSDGMELDNIAGTVTLDGTTANDNDGDGVEVENAGGAVTFTNVTASGNDPGVEIINAPSFSDTDGTYVGNDNHGIRLEDIAGNVTLVRTQADDNDAEDNGIGFPVGDGVGDGVTAVANVNTYAIGGNLLVQGGQFNDSDRGGIAARQQRGIFIESVGGNATFEDAAGPESVLVDGNRGKGVEIEDGVDGDVVVTNVVVTFNGDDGFDIDDDDSTNGGANTVTVTGSQFSRNGGTGLELDAVQGLTMISNTQASNNSSNGIDVNDMSGDVTIQNSVASGNDSDGLDFDDVGNVTLTRFTANNNGSDGIDLDDILSASFTDVTADGNSSDGAEIDNVTGNVSVMGGSMSSNDSDGLDTDDVGGNVTITGGTYNDNGDNGIEVDDVTGTTTITGGTQANGNGGDGIDIDPSGPVSINGATANGNAGDGVQLRDVGAVTLTNVTANNNLDDGLDVGPDTTAFGAPSLTITGGSYSGNTDRGIFPRAIGTGAGNGNIVINGATVTGNDVGLDLFSSIASVGGSNFNNNRIGVLIADNGLPSVVDLGLGDGGLSMNPGTFLPVSAGNNTFTSYTTASPTTGAIVNLTDNGANALPGIQGLPPDVAAMNNNFSNAIINPDLAIWHDFDDSGIGLVDFADLSNLQLKLNNINGPGAMPMINEMDILTVMGSFTAATDEHIVTIDWGDGSSDTFTLVGFTNTFTITHQYLDDNPSVSPQDTYNVKVVVEENLIGGDMIMNNPIAGPTDKVTVKNIAPALPQTFRLNGLNPFAPNPPISGVVGDTVTISGPFLGQATYTDPGILDTFEFLIDRNNDGVFDITVPVSGGVIPVTTFTVTEPTNGFRFRITDDDSGVGTVTVPANFTTGPVVARLFYNNSGFDGLNPAQNVADFAAIDPTKFPAAIGLPTTFASISGFRHGINGVFIDVPALPGDGDLGAPGAAGGQLAADDFNIRVGTTNNINTWAAGPAPAVMVFPNAGPGGSDRISIVFPDGSIVDEYVSIQMLANADTGIGQPMTFVFGSVIGDTGAAIGGAGVAFGRDAGDLFLIGTGIGNVVGPGDARDVDKSGMILAQDFTVVAIGGLTVADVFALPVITPGFAAVPAPGVASAAATDEALAPLAPLGDGSSSQGAQDGRVGSTEEDERDLAFATFGSAGSLLADDLIGSLVDDGLAV